jgi:hypothetical protein
MRLTGRFAVAATALTATIAAGLGVAAFVWTPAAGRPDGTVEMAERLRRVAAGTSPRLDAFRNRERVAMIEETLREKRGVADPPLLIAYATELLNSGRTAEALSIDADLEAMMRAHAVPPDARPWRDLIWRAAVASLRLAEDDNCRLHHNPRSCLFPLEGEGVHGEKRGARAAAATLDGLLAIDPGDLRARWLLNVAHMAIGDYPSGVPGRFLIAPERFAPAADIGAFPDVAAIAGLDVDDGAGGVIVDDFDGDDDLDLVASAMGVASPLRYFRNDGGGRFTEATETAGLTGENGGLNIVQTDYDNDGLPDVLVLRGGWRGRAGHSPNSLLHNDGGGHFSDVTVEAGLLSYHPTQTAAWSDFDGDGWLDLYIGNESTEGDPNPSELYLNDRDGTFTECAAAAGVDAAAFVKGVTAGDYNDDGRPDLYLSIRGETNRLYRNDGPRRGADGRRVRDRCALRFTDVAEAAGVTEPLFSFPTWFFDYDNDGHEDLFVSGYLIKDVGEVAADVLGLPHQAETPRLFHNRGDGTFENVTRAAGLDHVLLTMGSNYGDLDNDGWLDLHLGTGDPDLGTLVPNRTFRNDGRGGFQDITTSGGFGHLQKGHGVAFADLDDDGDLDLYQVMGGAFEADHFRNALYENPGQGHHFIEVELEGVRANRPGIGARLRLVATGPRGSRTIWRTLSSGGSFGASPLRAWFGLGEAEEVTSLEIRWPGSGTMQVLRGLRCDRRYRIREGEATPAVRPRSPSRLGGDRPDQVAVHSDPS